MSAYLRGEIYWVKFKIHGKTIRRSSGSATKREALAFERKLRAELENDHKRGQIAERAGITYGQALLRWINSGAPKSMWHHARNTRPDLENIPLAEVVPFAHKMKERMLREGLKNTTINRRLAVVRRVLNCAYKEWELLREPLGQKIKMLSEKGTSRELFLSKEEVTALVSSIQDPNIKNITMLAAYTGLRQGEIRRLTPENWQPPYIVLGSKTKGKKPRTIPLIPELHYIMTETKFAQSEWDIRKHFEAARTAIDRPDIRFHDLRHTFASWLIADPNIPLTVIRDLLGHSNLSVTSKYAHLRGIDPDLIAGALKGAHERGTDENRDESVTKGRK